MRAVIQDILLAQRGALFGWVPVCLACGIGVYFAWPSEPSLQVWGVLAVAALALLVLSRRVGTAVAPLFVALALVICGAGLAKWRSDQVAAPVLGFRYYGAVEGRIVGIDRSASDALRLTLDRVVLEDMRPARTPMRVRVSLHGDQPHSVFLPGETVIMTAHLSPPAGPAEPGGFDFQRHAWFLQLGAVGYTRTPVLRAAEAAPHDATMRIFALRMAISQAVRDAMPGETGAFAAAIMTGDRSGIAQGTLEDLRASNLAHLLAISGLHMGLLTGFVFAALRLGMAAVPRVALHWPVKKIAAAIAIAAGAFYLALSGGNVATERAFVMVAVMFVAVILGRPALSLRAVAMAAIVILALRPEALAGPGFQMSFAATTALVVVFAGLRRWDRSRLPRWTLPALSLLISSFVAGLATAPFAAAHFNQIPHYGLAANLLSVPLMGTLVMPAAVLAACLWPLGLWQAGLWVMDAGLRWILFVAQFVAGQDGALSHVAAPHWLVLPLLAAGLMWIVLWQGRARLGGTAAVAAAFVLWAQTDRPAVLVADTGTLVGVLGSEGRALSKPKGSGFVAGIWLENDGAPVSQELAAARAGIARDGRVARLQLGAWQVLQVSGKTALAAMQDCGGADLLITDQRDTGARSCTVFDLDRLRSSGALALDLASNGDLLVTTAQARAGRRPWNAHQAAADPPLRLSLAERTGPVIASRLNGGQ